MLEHSLACIRPSSFLPGPEPQNNINKNNLFLLDSSLFFNAGTQKEEPRGSELSVGPEDFGSVWQGRRRGCLSL